MKRLTLILALLFSASVFADTTDPGIVLRYGAYGARKTPCTRNTNADTFTTTIDSSSALGQKKLYLTATTDLAAGDVVVAEPGTAREEACVVDTVTAGDYVTCLANLTYTHPSGATDKTNRLPATGSTGYDSGKWYLVTCHNSTMEGAKCSCLWGTASVDAHYSVGEPLYAGEKVSHYALPGYSFISCEPTDDNTYVTVCPQD